MSVFRCLPFGWKYSLVLCQRVLERLIEEDEFVGVLVLIYLDGMLVVGRGSTRLRTQARCAVDALRAQLVRLHNPKSTLEPITRLVSDGG